jgi:hypothetical protein
MADTCVTEFYCHRPLLKIDFEITSRVNYVGAINYQMNGGKGGRAAGLLKVRQHS